MSLLHVLFLAPPRRFASTAPRRRTAARRRARRIGLQTERLETRLALSVSPAGAAEQAAVFARVSADWFATVAATPPAIPGGPAVAVSGSLLTTTAATAAATSEWIVRMSPDAVTRHSSVTAVAAALRSAPLGLDVVTGLGLPGQVLVRATGSEAAVREYLGARSDVVSFGPNALVRAAATPNDIDYAKLYGLHNTGQAGGRADADIDAPEAWELSTGSRSVVVAVIDSGIDWRHQDLAANMWRNPGEIAGDGIDNDANGFVDDVHGYDFVNRDGDPMDDDSHGTHCAGTIGAVGNNGIGVVGVNWQVSLMALKFLDRDGGGYTANAIRAINYATMMRDRGVNVRVTSNSWGGGGFDAGLQQAIDSGGKAGILFVAAAGNDRSDVDAMPTYPAAYDSPFIVSVAATDSADRLAFFSNYGARSVDLGAPGVGIVSTTPAGRYAAKSGTSMATPHVAGAAALAVAVDDSLTPLTLKAKLLASIDPVASLAGKTVTGGRLNVNTLVRSVGLTVASTSPGDGTAVGTPPTDFVVTFNHAFILASVDAADFRVNGRPATAFTPLSDRSVRFTFATSPVVNQGLQTMAIAGGALTRAGALTPSQPFSGSFRHDVLPLRVTSTLPAAAGVVVVPGALELRFNEPIDPASVQTADLVFAGLPDAVVTAATVLPGNTAVRFTIGSIAAEGPLTVTLAAGSVTDVHGNPNDSFTTSFGTDFGSHNAAPTPLRSQPAGARFAESTLQGTVGVSGDEDGFSITLDANQLLSVRVAPAAGLRPVVTVFGPGSGAPLAIHTAPAAGGIAIVQALPVTVAGSYRVAVTGAAGSAGAYTAQIRLNAAWESEGNGGPTNDTPAMAHVLDAAFRTEATSLSSVSLAIVTGVSDDGYRAEAVPYAFEDIATTGAPVIIGRGSASIPIGFAFPFFGDSHTSIVVNNYGLLTFGSGLNAVENTDLTTFPAPAAIAPFWTYLLGTSLSSIRSTVTGAGADQRLTIQWQNMRLPGGSTSESVTFQVQLYADGRIRFNYRDLVGGDPMRDEGRSATVGIKAAGQQDSRRMLLAFNEGPNAFVGSMKSTLLTPSVGRDLYSFQAAAGAVVSLALQGRDVGLELLDATGAVVAAGAAVTGGVDRAIDGLSLADGGTYYARITGLTAPYALVVTRGGVLDRGVARTVATATPLVSGRAVFGAVEPNAAFLASAEAYDFQDISATGTVINALAGQNDAAVGIPIGFEFPFFGDVQTSVFVSTNGTLAFGTANADRQNTDLTTAPVQGVIAAFWDDLLVPTTGKILYDVSGTGADRRLTIQWHEILFTNLIDVADTVTFQAQLFADGRIRFNYRDLTGGVFGNDGLSATVGAKAAGPQGDRRTLLAFNSGPNAFVGSGKSTLLQPNPGDWYVVTVPADGSRARFETSTPHGDLDPTVEFYDATGTVLIAAGTPLGDGRNESLLVSGLRSSETYRVLVSGAARTQGDYLLGFTTEAVGAPTGIALSTATVAENLPAGTVVGTLTSTDPEPGDRFTYALVGGVGSTDNAAFSIAGDRLVTATTFDYETRSSYAIRLRSTDTDGFFTEQAFTITAANVGDAPVLSGVALTASYTENAALTVTAAAAVVTDQDSPRLGGGALTVSIVANGEAADRLALRHQGTAAGQVGVSGTTVTFGGVAVATFAGGVGPSQPLVVSFMSAVTPAIAQAILRAVTYANVSEAPGTLPRTLDYRVTDETGLPSARVQQTVTVQAVNDAPVVGGIAGPLTYAENARLLTAPSATVFDIDSGDLATGRLTVRVAANATPADRLEILHQGTGAAEVGVAGTTVTFGGVAVGTMSGGTNGWSPLVVTFTQAATPAVVQAVARRIAFSIASDAPGPAPRTLATVLTDGDGGTSATINQAVTVVPANDAPTLSGVTATAAYRENAAPTLLAFAGLLGDPDSPQLGGGTLTVSIVANGEAADRLALRHQGTAAGQVGVSGTTVTFGGVAVATFAGGVGPSQPLVVSFTSAVTPAIAQAILRTVTYANVSEAPGTLPRTLDYRVRDGVGGLSAAVQQTVTVTAVNDAAVLGGIASSGLVFRAPGPFLLAPAATVADVDSTTFDGGSLQVAFAAGGLSSDRLLIRSQGTAPGQVGVTGGVVSHGGVAIGTVTGGSGLTPLTIGFTGAATADAVQAVLRSIAYDTNAIDPTNRGLNPTRTIRSTFTDAPPASGGLATVVLQSLAFA